MSESWVINASPVILLAKVGLIENVPSLADSFVIPEPVVTEILSVHDDAAAHWLTSAGKKFVQPSVPELAALSNFDIGLGERSVLSWAKAHSGFTVVLDDREARVAAHQLGLKVLGTVGVVIRLKRAGLISEMKPHLIEIRRVGGYISDELLREVLQSAGEQP